MIVRATAGYDLPHCLRITIGTVEECQHAIDALQRFLNQPAPHG